MLPPPRPRPTFPLDSSHPRFGLNRDVDLEEPPARPAAADRVGVADGVTTLDGGGRLSSSESATVDGAGPPDRTVVRVDGRQDVLLSMLLPSCLLVGLPRT
jgi:hypothetical protein